MTVTAARAIRNNNPGNIRIGQPWAGLMPGSQMTPEQKQETEFCVFDSPMWGFRAMGLILRTYANRFAAQDRPFCVATIIGTWAPPADNNKTDAYVEDVAERIGVDPDDILICDRANMMPLVKAISLHEVGLWAFSDDDLETGMALAFPAPPLVA